VERKTRDGECPPKEYFIIITNCPVHPIRESFRSFRGYPNLTITQRQFFPFIQCLKTGRIFCMDCVLLPHKVFHSRRSVHVGMQGCAPPSSSSPPTSSVSLCLISAISTLLSFLLRVWVLGALGWAAMHEDLFYIFYLVSTLFRSCGVLVCWLCYVLYLVLSLLTRSFHRGRV
jgi:hypothetical protein